MIITRATWDDAETLRKKLHALAQERYPVESGHYHELQADGWPDPRCRIAVYRTMPDRRFRRGQRLDLVARLTGADLA